MRAGSAAVVVVVNAVIQAVLIAVAPREPLTGASVALAVVSGVALLAASLGLWAIAAGGRAGRLLIPLAATAVFVALLAVAAPYLVPLGLGLSCLVVVRALPAGRGLVRRRPWRALALLLITIVGAALAFVLAMVLGLFVSGAPAAGLTWLVVGAGAAVVIDRWVALARHRAAAELAQP